MVIAGQLLAFGQLLLVDYEQVVRVPLQRIVGVDSIAMGRCLFSGGGASCCISNPYKATHKPMALLGLTLLLAQGYLGKLLRGKYNSVLAN